MMTAFRDHFRRLFRRQAAAVTAALALGIAVPVLVSGPVANAATAAASCAHATGPFHVSGTSVLNSAGQVFTPYGITVPGLANMPLPAGQVAADHSKIVATADSGPGQLPGRPDPGHRGVLETHDRGLWLGPAGDLRSV